MLNFEYCSPTKIYFGKDTVGVLPEAIRSCGGTRVALIYGGKSAKKSGLLDRVLTLLSDAGIPTLPLGGVVPNPLVSTAAKMAEETAAFGADFLLAVGGGSVIDTAKGIALSVANRADVGDIWQKKAPAVSSLPVGVVLTISAAGSETSNSAVLTDDRKTPPTKRGFTTELNRPVFAVLDPTLTMTLPPYQIGAGAADIFMHTSERYFTTVLGNRMTDEIAEGVFRNIVHYGPIGVNDPGNYEAMSEIMWTGSISHSGMTGNGAKGNTARDGDWACHQLGMAISALRDSTHGATLSAVFGAWARYVHGENPARFAQFARKVYGVAEENDEKAALEGIRQTESFFASLGMPLTLTELLGHVPTDSELIDFATECSFGHSRTIGTFKVLGYDDMLAIYRNAR